MCVGGDSDSSYEFVDSDSDSFVDLGSDYISSGSEMSDRETSSDMGSDSDSSYTVKDGASDVHTCGVLAKLEMLINELYEQIEEAVVGM